MGFEYYWRTQQGQRTIDNRDYCGIGLRPNTSLCIVLDGSTSGANSGDLACQMATRLINWFMEVTGSVTAETITDYLREIHKIITPAFLTDSTSYVILLIEDKKPIVVLHAGDCLAGCYNKMAPVSWQMSPHTLANAIEKIPIEDIAKSPLRNSLTRSFRARKFCKPDICSINHNGDKAIVIGTDGFWADLDLNDQNRFLVGANLTEKKEVDDCSALIIKNLAPPQESRVSTPKAPNIYIVDSR